MDAETNSSNLFTLMQTAIVIVIMFQWVLNSYLNMKNPKKTLKYQTLLGPLKSNETFR